MKKSPPNKIDLKEEDIVKLYVSGKNYKEIARLNGCSTHPITRILKNNIKVKEQFLSRFNILVDKSDYFKVKEYLWRVSPSALYARSTINNKRFSLQQYIYHINNIRIPKGYIIDHKNGITTDNRKCNLRLANLRQNIANSKKKINTISKFKGVSYCNTEKRNKRWVAACEYNGKRITIGRFNDEILAAKAYDKKAYQLWGKYAKLNF